MVVGNIDNAEPATEKIAVGSLQGMLRIYSPTRPQFRVEDLILEESLGAPILQLLLGRFIPASNMLGLAVLHPKRLVVYELIPQSKYRGLLCLNLRYAVYGLPWISIVTQLSFVLT
jgi:Bardet-Biedl syndrome 9 protein